MDVVRSDDGNKGSFYMGRDGKRLAEMFYTRAGEEMIIIDHTDVADELRGQGAGKKLVHAAVDWARAADIKIIPLCPFAKSVFDKDERLRDVLK